MPTLMGTKNIDKIHFGEILPKEFQELEYIKSTRTQYIDTGIKVSDLGTTAEWYLTISLTSGDNSYNGSYKQGSAFQIGLTYDLRAAFNYAFSSGTSYSGIQSNTWYTLYLSSGAQKVDDIIVGTQTAQNDLSENTNNLLLFARSEGSSKILYGATIKRSTLYSNHVVIQDLVPARRKADGEVGMYDMVNNQFYTNQGTGTFIAGHEAKRIRRVYTGNDLVYGLPTNMQELEYIQSSGTQYIDSGVNPNSKLGLSFSGKFNASSSQPERYPRIFGAQASGGIMLGSRYWYTPNTDTSRTNTLSVFNDEDFTFFADNRKITLNGVDYDISPVATTAPSGLDNIHVFAAPQKISPGSSNSSAMKLYNFRIYDSSTLVRNFVPAKAKTASKNLMDLSSCSGWTYTNSLPQSPATSLTIGYSSEKLSISSSSNSYIYALSGLINLEPNTAYTISYNRENVLQGSTQARRMIYTYDNGNYVLLHHLAASDSGNQTYTFTTSSSGIIAIAFGYNNNSYGSTSTISNFQLEEGSTATPYDPYYEAGKVGLYDLVNNRFYINAGTGDFVAGEEV